MICRCIYSMCVYTYRCNFYNMCIYIYIYIYTDDDDDDDDYYYY